MTAPNTELCLYDQFISRTLNLIYFRTGQQLGNTNISPYSLFLILYLLWPGHDSNLIPYFEE